LVPLQELGAAGFWSVLPAPGLVPLQALPAFFSVWVLPASGLAPPQALLPLAHPETAKLEPAIRLAILNPANIFLSWFISMRVHLLSNHYYIQSFFQNV
jgi:hypothetical protein